MSIRSGQILHDARGFVIDRIQSGGLTNLNVPLESVYEVGNFLSVEQVQDTATETFEIESFDVSTEIEALIVHEDPTTTNDGDEFDFQDAIPISIISPFRSTRNAFDITKGIIYPYMTLSGVSYRYGVGANATQTFTFEGETPYYSPGPPKLQSYTLVAASNQTYTLANTAIAYVEQGNTIFATSVCLHNLANGKSRRLYFASDGTTATGDFTNTSTSVTILANWSADYPAVSSVVEITYGTTASTTYSAAVNASSSVKPGAVRGKDITVTIGDGAATPTNVRWSGVQSIQADWRVTLESDQELGNPHYVAQDYDIPEVSGNVVVRSIDTSDLWTKIAQVAGVATNVIAGPYASPALTLDIVIHHPDTGDALKTIYCPDARITIPAVNPRVQSKLDQTFNFKSDTGSLLVYQGERP